MLPVVLSVVGAAAPAVAFVFPLHSSARTVLATSIFWWALPCFGLAWLAAVNYSFSSRIEGSLLTVATVGGRRVIDLRQLDRIRSFSMWGQFGGTHTLRLHARDGQHAMVVASMPLASFNRSNVLRQQRLRDALAEHGELADARGRWWLGLGPRPSRWAGARHVAAMLTVYVVAVVALLVALVGYLAVALD